MVYSMLFNVSMDLFHQITFNKQVASLFCQIFGVCLVALSYRKIFLLLFVQKEAW